MEYIYNQFKQVLLDNGVDQYGEEGEDFDEKKYLSLENMETEEEAKDGKVAQVVQKGYKIGDKILREAKVKTYKYKKPE